MLRVLAQGGGFRAHEDKQSLTVLVNLSTSGADFQGGGTAFWNKTAACDPATGRGAYVNEPTMALCPPAGSAIIFGGNVWHAGQPVLGGKRLVFVASFSPLSEKAAAATAATTIATAIGQPPAADDGASDAASEYQVKQQLLRDQRNAYEARVEAETARKQALVTSLQALSTEGGDDNDGEAVTLE